MYSIFVRVYVKTQPSDWLIQTTGGGYTDGEYRGNQMAESSADFGGGITYAESQQYHDRQQQMDRLSEGSGQTEDGDGDVDYTTKGGDDDGRYPEKAQLEEAGYRYESALRSCGHGKAQWQVHPRIHNRESRSGMFGHDILLFSRLTMSMF